MREILFRGRRLGSDEWIFGGYQSYKGTWHYIMPDDDSLNSTEWYEVDPKTIGQYTGLTDISGKKIFEGDICEMTYNGESKTYVIVWDNEEQDFKGTNGTENYGRNYLYMGCCEKIVVIGNIYDNSELLKG